MESKTKRTRHDLVQTKPAEGLGERWRDATPLGNGLTGASLYGGCRRDSLVFHRHDLWHNGRECAIPDVSDAIPEMRSLIAQGKEEEACSLLTQRLDEAGYGNHLADMRPVGQVELVFPCDGVYRRYARVLHMDSGVSDITYELGDVPFRRRTFVSRKADVTVCRLESGVPSGFTAEAGFFPSGEAVSREIAARDAANAVRRVVGDALVYATKNDDGRWFGLACRVVTDGILTVTDTALAVENATDSLLLVRAFSRETDREKAIAKAVAAVEKLPADYGKLLLDHTRLHRRLYNTADLRLYSGRRCRTNEELLEEARQEAPSPELTEKLWRFGRYLFISGTHPKGNPFPLYGLWCAGYARPWCQNVANENVEIIHWHASVGGLSSLLPALISYYAKNIPVYREAAAKLFGCRGIFVSAYTTPVNTAPNPAVPVILHFCGTAGWLCRHFYEYYLYTEDEKRLTEEILPFMLETARFYEDFATVEQGVLHICPGVSPENSPAEYQDTPHPTATGHPMPVTDSPTVEIAICKELLTHLLALAETHPLPRERVEKWKEMLAAIPPYRVNAQGAIAEWIPTRYTDWNAHRHLSHLYPLFPGDELREAGDSRLIPAFRRAVDDRELGTMTGWSLAHMAGIYARLEAGDRAFSALTMLSKVCLLPNFFTLHNDYRGMGITSETMGDASFAPVQLDALMGWVNGVQEMLLQATASKVAFLPALPEALPTGQARLTIPCAAVELWWDAPKKQFGAVFCAKRKATLTVAMPFGLGEREITLIPGQTQFLIED